MATTTPIQKNSRIPVRPTKGQARFAFTILFIINILNYTDRYVLPAILPKIQQDLGLNNTELGLLGSSFLLVYALGTLPIGIWADRGIRKNIIALCVGVWSIATMLSGLTQNFIQLFSVRAILGIGEAGYAPASLSQLGDLFPKAQRGRILSYWSSGMLIGAAIGFTCGGLIADAFGWRWAFYLVGIPGLIAAFLAWRSIEPARGAFDNEEEIAVEDGVTEQEVEVPVHGGIGADFWESAVKLLKIRTYWALLVAMVFSFFTIGGTSFWLPTYFVDTFKLTVGKAGLISGGVLVASGLIGTLLGGWLADAAQRRWVQGRLLVAILGFLLGAPLVLIALFIHSLPMFIGVFFLAGIALNFCNGPINAVIQDIITPAMRATAVGISLLLAHLLGDAAAPTLIGSLADKYTLLTSLTITAPTCLFLAGLVCLLGLRTVARDMHNMQKELRTHIQQE